MPGQGSPPKVAAERGISQRGLPTQAAVATATLDAAWHAPCSSAPHMPVGVPYEAKVMEAMVPVPRQSSVAAEGKAGSAAPLAKPQSALPEGGSSSATPRRG